MNQISLIDHPFDAALRLEPVGDGRFLGQISAEYWNLGGPFGGLTAALLLGAALGDPRCTAPPVALTVNYCAALVQGAASIAVRPVRAGRSTQHWQLELIQDGSVAATASVVTGVQRPVWSHQPAVAPAVAPPEQLARLDTAGRGAWLQRYEFRIAQNPPHDPNSDGLQSPRSAVWVRDAPARPLDRLSLAALADTLFVRPFQVRGYLVPMATVSMTTYFFASDAQLAAQGSRPLLSVGDARVFRHGFNDQLAELWSDTGELLAVSTQVVWFRA